MENRPKRQLSLKLGQQKLFFKSNDSKQSKSSSQSLSTLCDEEAPIIKKQSNQISDGDTPSLVTPSVSQAQQQDHRSTDPLYSGLCNLGNTCYVNSVLQVLRFCPKFSRGVFDMQNILDSTDGSVTNGNPSVMDSEGEERMSSNSLSSHLCKLWERMAQKEKTVSRVTNKTTTLSATKPDLFLTKLREENQLFDNKFQHDAQEMLRFLLTNLHETYTSVTMNLDLPETPPPTTSTPTHMHKCWDVIDVDAIKDEHEQLLTKSSCKKRKLCSMEKSTQPIGKLLKLNSGRAKRVFTTKKIYSYFTPLKGSTPSIDTTAPLKLEKIHNRPRLDFISRTFQGSLAYQTRCFECDNTTRRSESFLDISLPVSRDGLPGFPPLSSPMKTALGESNSTPASYTSTNSSMVGPYSLSWCISQFALREKLRGENKYHCDECGRFTEAERSVLFGKLPKVMTIHLNRFTTQMGGLFSNVVVNKVGGNIAVPLAISFRSWTTDDCKEREKVYQLFAVVFHSGSSCLSGHYTACVRVRECVEATETPLGTRDCRGWERNGWLYFDDENVEYITQSGFMTLLSPLSNSSSTAYVLFYAA